MIRTIRRTSAIAVCLGVAATFSGWAQVTTFDGVYDTVGKADPQNSISCNQNVQNYPIKVTGGSLNGPDRKPVTIGANGVAEEDGKLLVASSITTPYKVTYRFTSGGFDSDLVVDLVRGSGQCIYHRHGTKRS